MTTLIRNSTSPHSLPVQVLYQTLRLAAAGAAGGAFFGVLFGVVANLLPGLPWTIAGLAGYFAISGGSAGFLVGLLGTWFEGKPEPETGDLIVAATLTSSNAIERQHSVPLVGAGMTRKPENRVAALMNTKANRTPGVALRNPSRN